MGPLYINRKHLSLSRWNATFFVVFLTLLKMNFLYFTKLRVLLLPDTNLFKYNFAKAPRDLWSGNSNLFNLFQNIRSFKFKICKLATIEAFFNCWWRTKPTRYPLHHYLHWNLFFFFLNSTLHYRHWGSTLDNHNKTKGVCLRCSLSLPSFTGESSFWIISLLRTLLRREKVVCNVACFRNFTLKLSIML